MKISLPSFSLLRWGGRLFGRSSFLALEIVAALVGLLVLLAAVFMWRLTTGPFDLAFARDYVEHAIRDNESGYAATIQGAHLSWPQTSGPVVLSLRGVNLLRHDQSFLSVREMDMSVAVRPLFFGHIRPVSVRLKEPSMRLYRSPDNKFDLSLNGETETPHIDQNDNILESVIAALARDSEDRRNWGPLAYLRQFDIMDARMVVEDHVLNISWYIAPLDLSFARDREGLAISATLELPGGSNRASVVVADAIYNPRKTDLVVNLHLQDIDPRALAQKIDALAWFRDQNIVVNGDLTMIADPQGKIRRVGMNLSSENGLLNLPAVHDRPMAYEEVAVNATYDHENGKFLLDNLALTLGGIEMQASSAMEVSANRIHAPLTIKLPNVPLEALARQWPAVLNDTSARKWFTERLSVGRLHDGVVTLDVSAQRVDGALGEESKWDAVASHLMVDAKMQNITVDYNKPMIPIIGAQATAQVRDDTMTINIESGKMDEMEIESGKVIITELTSDKTGHAEIDALLNGPIKSILRYIEREPIAFNAERAGIRTEQVQGTGKVNVNVSFPTLKDLPKEQVKVKAQGTAYNLVLPGMIKDMDVGGNEMKVSVADGTVTIKGPGTILGRAAPLDFTAFFDSTGKPYVFQAKSTIKADYELRQKFGAGLEDWVTGDPTVNITYTEQRGGKADVLVDGKVDDVILHVKPMKYEKAVGVGGTASARIVLQNTMLQEVVDLNVNTPDLKVEKGRLVFERTADGGAHLRRGTIARARLAETDVALDFEQAQGGPMQVTARGAFLDARPFLAKDKTNPDERYQGPGVKAQVDVARMRTHPGRMVEKVSLASFMNNQGDMAQFSLDALVGSGPLKIRLGPANGKMAIQLDAQDAGAVLRAFDIYENAQGGQLKIYGEQVPESNKSRMLLRGSGEMTNFRVTNAPALARIVGALSLSGMAELLQGQGISFNRLQSDFDWVITRGGDAYYLRNGRTSGSSIGLTFEGKIDKREDVMDVGGTVVPVTFVNDFITNIPLLGDLLTGGEGALIAATYSMKGPVKTPTVMVNPLSALTPGILRRMFFEENKVDRAPDSVMGPPARPGNNPPAPHPRNNR
ncbi:MAG TPA: DUF3971 domain-containing protein [Micavibrio sp.]